MKALLKAVRLTALALALAGTAGVASAQSGGGASDTTGGGTGSGGGAATRDTRSDRGFDWGWLGLLGLAGLIPLFVRRDRHADHTTINRGPNHGTAH